MCCSHALATGEFTSVDNFYHGTRTAALGGVTCVIDFVIPWDEQSLAEALENKFQDARNCWVDYSFHLNIRGDVQAKIREIPIWYMQVSPASRYLWLMKVFGWLMRIS